MEIVQNVEHQSNHTLHHVPAIALVCLSIFSCETFGETCFQLFWVPALKICEAPIYTVLGTILTVVMVEVFF